MKLTIDGIEFEVIIKRKIRNKNTYIIIKDDMNIYVTTNCFISIKSIIKLITKSEKQIIKMYNRKLKQLEEEKKIYYLGKEYDINNNIDINKWLRKQASIIYKEELDRIYKIFPVDIPYPSLTIRNMKTRWGVCNVKTKRITLNLSLIKKDIKYLDYVIVHELSHLVHPNHSKDFWNLVSLLIPDYKKIRKELNNYE